MAVTPASFLDRSNAVPALQVAAGSYPIDASFASRGLPERVLGARVTDGFFAVWDTRAAVGRTLRPDDFGGGAAAVIGHQLWLDHFGGQPDVVGTAVRIDGTPYTIVGVMPATFRGPRNEQVWVPWIMSADERLERRFHLVGTIARLRRGESLDQAQAQLGALYERLRREHSEVEGWQPAVVPLRAALVGDVTDAVPLLVGTAATLVAVAWANLVGLLLGAWPRRRAEMLVRLALGASPRQLVAHSLVEIATWAAIGSVAGLALAHLLQQAVGRVLFAGTTFDFAPRIDARLMAAVMAFLVVTLLLVVLGPLARTVSREVDLTPKRHRSRRSRLATASAVGQMAGSNLLLAVSTSLVTGVSRLSAQAADEMASSLLAIEVSLSELQQPDEAQHRTFFSRLLESLASRPELADVAAASYIPPAAPLGNVRFEIAGRAGTSDDHSAVASAVDPGAFRLLGLKVIRGRAIGSSDGPTAPFVAVVSEALARRYWPTDDVVGQRLRVVGMAAAVSVVGVVADVHQPLASDSRVESVLYLSYLQVPWPFMTVVAGPRNDVAAAVRAVREEVARLAPDQATGAMHILRDLRSDWLVAPRARATVLGLFGAAALGLTLVGLYGSVTREVTSRFREFAIRQALGAAPLQVVAALTVRAVAATASGLMLGVGLLFVVFEPVQRQAKPDLAPLEGWSLAALLVLTGAVALVTAFIPARRASTANPADTLRAE